MHAVHVPVLAAAIVLVGSGLNKIWRPVPTARAVRALLQHTRARTTVVARTASSPGASRALGVLEVATGAAVLGTTWHAATWVLAALYAGFALFVGAALLTGAPLESCGCFGEHDRPPDALHVALCTAVAALAVAAVTDDALGAPRHTLTASHGSGAAAAIVVAVALWAVLRGRSAPRAAVSARPARRGRGTRG